MMHKHPITVSGPTQSSLIRPAGIFEVYVVEEASEVENYPIAVTDSPF